MKIYCSYCKQRWFNQLGRWLIEINLQERTKNNYLFSYKWLYNDNLQLHYCSCLLYVAKHPIYSVRRGVIMI